MNGAEWNLTGCTSYFGQVIATTMQQENIMNMNCNSNQNIKTEEEKIFTELRPANTAVKHEGREMDGGIRSDEQSNVEYCLGGSHRDMMVEQGNVPCTEETITCIDSSNRMEERSKYNRLNQMCAHSTASPQGIMQQQFPFDMNLLKAFETVPFGNLTQQCPGTSNADANGYGENAEHRMIDDFKNYLRIGTEDFEFGVDGDGFKFPACVEEEYRKLSQCDGRVKQEETKNLPHFETVFNTKSMKCGMENWKAVNNRMETSDNEHSASTLPHCSFEKQPNIKIEKQDLLSNDVNINNKGRGIQSEVTASVKQERVESNEVENLNVESILDLISPTKDVMGKTFHKIPSTQPIYSDFEAKQYDNDCDDGDTDENRVRRPMNAFMLWARKYRSFVAKEFSDASNSEISVKLGEIWNELSSEQQKPYFQKAETLKADHKQNHPNYVYQPRQTRFRQGKRPKIVSNQNTKKDCEEKRAVATISHRPMLTTSTTSSSNSSSQIAFKRVSNLECMQNIGHVASTVVLEHDGTEVDLAQHVSKPPQLLVPKPQYPKGMQRQSDPLKEAIIKREETTTTDFALTCNEVKRVLATENQLYEVPYDNEENNIGLVRDAMLPNLNKHADGEGDYVDEDGLILPASAGFSSFNVMELDAYLAGKSCKFEEYFEKHTIFDGEQIVLKKKRAKGESLRGKKRRAVGSSNKQKEKKSNKQKQPRITKKVCKEIVKINII
eukprot:gene5367-6038_t